MNLTSKGASWMYYENWTCLSKSISYHCLYVILNHYINYLFQSNFGLFNEKFGNTPQANSFII